MLEEIGRVIFDSRPRISGKYIEPFLGGGVFLINVEANSKIGSDINRELINSYDVVRDDCDQLISALKKIRSDRETYQEVAASKPRSQKMRAARFVYLNRHSFGGLYRENKQGIFNVPFGGPRGFSRLQEGSLLRAASSKLTNATFFNSDFEVAMSMAEKGDLVFCDPVYRVDESTRVFDRYNSKGFCWADLERLVDKSRECEKRGACVVITLPESKAVRALLGKSPTTVIDRSGAFGIRDGFYYELVYKFGSLAGKS